MADPLQSCDTTRRGLLGAAVALAAGALASPARAQASIVDAAGRRVATAGTVTRVFPAGPPAAIQLYTLAPDLLLGWPRANRPEEREFLLPGVGDRPEVGRIAGRGGTANLEVVLSARPDLIVDIGSTRRTFVEMADRVQEQTRIPYALIDGRFEQTPQSYRLLGDLVGRSARAAELAAFAEETMRDVRARVAAIPRERRPRVYYARGPAGLETGLGGSINVELLDYMGVVNVAAEQPGGLAQVSLEQVLRWNPDVVITIDQTFAATVRDDPLWRSVRAVQDGRVHLSPKLPFGWVDFPPGVNRLMGLRWLGAMIFPQAFPESLPELTMDFHRRFYHVPITPAQAARVLEGRV